MLPPTTKDITKKPTDIGKLVRSLQRTGATLGFYMMCVCIRGHLELVIHLYNFHLPDGILQIFVIITNHS